MAKRVPDVPDLLNAIVEIRQRRVDRAKSTNDHTPGTTPLDTIDQLEIELLQARIDVARQSKS